MSARRITTRVLRTASTLTVILLAVGFLALALIFVRRSRRAEPAVVLFGSLLAIILLLQFPFSLRLWNAAPHLAFLQFPWRWLLVASVIAACLLAIALSPSISVSRQRWQSACAVIAVSIIVGGSTWACAHRFYLYCDDQDLPAGQLASFHNGAGVQGTDEYTAMGADNSAIFQDLPQVRLLTIPDAEEPQSDAGDNPEWPGFSLGAIDSTPGNIAITKWEPEVRQLNVTTTRPAFAVIALMDYPSWRVSVNGHAVIDRPKREDGMMAIPIGAGASAITVQWSTSKDIILGRALSALAMLILMFMIRRDVGAPSYRR